MAKMSKEQGPRHARWWKEHPEFKRKMSALKKEEWRNPERRRKAREVMCGLNRDPTFRNEEARLAGLQQFLQNNPDFHERRVAKVAAAWRGRSSKGKRLRKEASDRMRALWSDPVYRRKSQRWRKWWGPEIFLRDRILKPLGLWGRRTPTRFRGHRVVGGKGFQFEADFACVESRLIVHVDGPTHYRKDFSAYEWRAGRDREIDLWCVKNDWAFLRLTDLDVYRKPNMCRNLIRRLIEGRIVPLILDRDQEGNP